MLLFHTHIEERQTSALDRGLQFKRVPPIHADVGDGTVIEMLDHEAKKGLKKGDELAPAHLARRHRELRVLDLAQTTDVAAYRHVVRRVGERHRTLATAEQLRPTLRVQG